MTSENSTGRPRIVVGVDGSQQSKDALRWAARLAALPGTEAVPVIQAVIAWDFPVPYGFGAPTPGMDISKETGEILADTVAEVFPDGPPDGLIQTVREGGAAQVLIEMSEGALLAVVGSRGHGGFTGMLLGSVSARVAEYAHCPVMVVHGDKDHPAPSGD